jgi:hypothetical protein
MTLITIQANDKVRDSRSDINDNFSYLEGEINTKVDTTTFDAETVKLTGNQTVDGVKTFSSSPVVPTPTTDMQASTKKYVDDIAIAGSPDASTTAKGIVEIATRTEINAKTGTGSTGAILVVPASLAPTFEVTAGATHSLVSLADQRVMVWAKGQVAFGGSADITLTLKYNGVTKDTVIAGFGSATTGITFPFSLMYTEIPGADTQDITVEASGGTLGNVVIMVIKY